MTTNPTTNSAKRIGTWEHGGERIPCDQTTEMALFLHAPNS